MVMTPSESVEAVRYAGLELGPEGVAEWVGERRAVFVPRNAIVAVDLERGVAAERPVLQSLFAGTSVLLGLLLLASLAGLFAHGDETGAPRFAAGGAPLAILGVWMFWNGLRPVYYLRVRTADDARKLLLPKKIDWAELSKVLYQSQRRFGYLVNWADGIARPSNGSSVDLPYREAVAKGTAPAADRSPPPQSSGIPDERAGNGVQWGNVAPLGAIFAASWIIGYLFGNASSGWADRAETALASAATMFGETIVAIWILARVVGRRRFSSWHAFALIWLAVTIFWLFAR